MAEKTEQSPAPEAKEKKPQKAPASTPRKKSGFFSFIIFLIAAAALGLSAYIAQQGLQLKNHVSSLQTELSQLRLLDQQPIIQSLMQEINTQNQTQQTLQKEIKQRFEDWQKTLDASKSLSEQKKDDWILNEVAYLMRMAATRLYLASDINSSIAALTQADLRLGELQNPRYIPIRKTLGSEISALQSLQAPDIDGTALKIERLMNNLPVLPEAIISKEEETDIVEEQTNAEPKNLLAKLMSIIGLKQNAGKVPTAATRDNLLFLDQLIRLELESAKQALIRFKEEDFNNHLNRASGLLKKHYKQNNETVIKALGQLNNIIDANIFPELPDITKSLNLLQSMLNRYKAPEEKEKKIEQPETKTEQTT